MATFYQTWNLVGSSQFTYICFDASTRKAAEIIGDKWKEYKAESCESTSNKANGYQGSLISKSEAKTWKYKSGGFILDETMGRDRWQNWQKSQKPPKIEAKDSVEKESESELNIDSKIYPPIEIGKIQDYLRSIESKIKTEMGRSASFNTIDYVRLELQLQRLNIVQRNLNMVYDDLSCLDWSILNNL